MKIVYVITNVDREQEANVDYIELLLDTVSKQGEQIEKLQRQIKKLRNFQKAHARKCDE
jgi:predicted ATP-grasp superfamily ATP-dependent carboligase